MVFRFRFRYLCLTAPYWLTQGVMLDDRIRGCDWLGNWCLWRLHTAPGCSLKPGLVRRRQIRPRRKITGCRHGPEYTLRDVVPFLRCSRIFESSKAIYNRSVG